MAKVGAPLKYSPENIEKICQLLSKYIDENDVPILAEFCYLNDVSRQALYASQYPQFATLREKCLTKKEANLERLAANGAWDTRMAIFSLRQLGWTDRKEVEHSGSVDSKVQIYLPANNRMLQEVVDDEEEED
jgi:hypothetical protein